MAITKASSNAVAPAAKGDLVVGTTTNDSGVLAVGANGTVLTAASGQATGLEWATPAAGGMTLLETLTLSGASVTSSTIPGTYKNLALVVKSYKPATGGEELQMRINGDSNANRYHYSTNTSTINTNFGFTSIRLSVSGNSTATATGLAFVDIYDYANTTTWKITQALGLCNGANDGTQVNYQIYFGAYNQTGAITSLTFFPNSGNFTSGSILIYGVL